MSANRDLADAMSSKWEREASGYESQSRSAEYTDFERRLLQMHARIKRLCASELRAEAGKVRRG